MGVQGCLPPEAPSGKRPSLPSLLVFLLSLLLLLFLRVLFSLVASLSLSHPGCTTRNTWWRRSMRISSTLSASLTRRTCAYVLGGTESPCRSGGGSPRSCTGINSSRCPRLHNRSSQLLAIFFSSSDYRYISPEH